MFLPTPSLAKELEWVIPPEPGQIGKNIHFVVDFSGSMNEEDISAAIKQTIDIASQSVDEINIKVTVFGRNYVTWEGIKNEKQPGWTSLPSNEAIEALAEWFKVVQLDNGDTLVSNPVGAALEEDIDNLTIIVISDMAFTDDEEIFVRIKNLQAIRTHKATFGFIQIDESLYLQNLIGGRCAEISSWFAVLK